MTSGPEHDPLGGHLLTPGKHSAPAHRLHRYRAQGHHRGWPDCPGDDAPAQLLALDVVVVPALEMMTAEDTRSALAARHPRDHQRCRHVTDEDYHQR
jgi:hypothetical protein